MSSDTPLTPPPYDPAGVSPFSQATPSGSDDPSYPASVVPYAQNAPQYPGPAYGLHGNLSVPAYALQPRATEPLAVVSLIAGILGFLLVLPFIGSLVAIITGHIALGRIRSSGSLGSGMSVTGLVLGYISLACAIALGALLLLFVAVPIWAGMPTAR